jgi:hypothetical protein
MIMLRCCFNIDHAKMLLRLILLLIINQFINKSIFFINIDIYYYYQIVCLNRKLFQMNSAALVIQLLATLPMKITQADNSTTNKHRQHMNGIPSNSGIAHYAIPLFLDSNVGWSSPHHVSIMSLMEEQFDCKK